MKKLFKTVKRKWTEYLIEIIVISVGILLAFTLNSWNENRKLANRLDQYRSHLKVELTADIEALERSEDNLERYRNSITNYLDYYNSVDRNIDTLVRKLDNIDYGLNTFTTAVYTIEELIFSGNLSTFPEDEKSALLKLRNTHENAKYYERENIRDVLAMDYEKEMDMLFMKGYATNEHIEVKNWRYNVNSSQFRLNNNHIASVLGFLNWQEGMYKDIKNDTQALLDLML